MLGGDDAWKNAHRIEGKQPLSTLSFWLCNGEMFAKLNHFVSNAALQRVAPSAGRTSSISCRYKSGRQMSLCPTFTRAAAVSACINGEKIDDKADESPVFEATS